MILFDYDNYQHNHIQTLQKMANTDECSCCFIVEMCKNNDFESNLSCISRPVLCDNLTIGSIKPNYLYYPVVCRIMAPILCK